MAKSAAKKRAEAAAAQARDVARLYPENKFKRQLAKQLKQQARDTK